MAHAGHPFEFKSIGIPGWVIGGGKKKYGGMPFCTRSDGSIMKETDAMMRYICRQSGLYPTDPLTAYKNDWFCEPDQYGTFFNKVHQHIL